ncbi:MAG TPA: glycosyltransferase [Ignavibacteria bacterium]|nr:glycosyltransferase [Ignavibacteria bacterium]
MNTKVFHISPENTAGVPYNVMAMQNKFGMAARLLTFYKIPFNFHEDICLDLPIPRSKLAMKWREFKQSNLHKKIKEQNLDSLTHLPYFKPANSVELAYMKRREKRNEGKLLRALNEMKADTFDIIHFGSGIDYYSDSRLAKKWKKAGKKIINCYYGDDLRTRGIVKDMDELSDLNLTFEYDHTLRHQNVNFLYFPFDADNVKYTDDESYNSGKKIRIIHSPTHRFIKGTEFVIAAIDKVKKSKNNIEFILIENQPREKVIEVKTTCHIAIDQIGNRGGTGYGINSLETLAMGLPTITDMNGGMETWLPDNPFIVASSNNLAEKIIETIDNIKNIALERHKLRKWVIKYHSYESVFKKLLEYYKNYKII